MIWSIFQVVSKQIVTLSVFAILAIFLDPADFGLLGMAMVCISFVQIFSEMGFSAALIQRKEISSKHFSTVFFINIACGGVLTILGLIISWPCAWFFKSSALQPIIAALSFGIIISSFSLTHMAMLQKNLNFRFLAIRDISAAIVGGVVGIVMAFMKFGVWSLVAQSITSYLLSSILLWGISDWRPALKEFSFECMKELWPYSSKIFSFQLFKFLTQNIDKIIIGYFLGSFALGLYTFAYKFVVYPVSVLSGAIGVYLFPKYSKIQDDLGSVKSSFIFIVKLTNSVVIPIMVVVIMLSPILIPMYFGDKWNQSVSLIPIMSVLAVIMPWISYSGQGMKALARPGWLFNWSIFITILTSMFMYIGMKHEGVYGVTLGGTIAYIVSIPVNYFIINKLINISVYETFQLFCPSVLSGAIVCILFWGCNLIFSNVLTSVYYKMIFIVLVYLLNMMLLDRCFVLNVVRRITHNVQSVG